MKKKNWKLKTIYDFIRICMESVLSIIHLALDSSAVLYAMILRRMANIILCLHSTLRHNF